MSVTDKTQKTENPETTFAKPLDVVKDSDLSCQQKEKALETWEQGARELLIASSEGMTAPEEGDSPKDPNELQASHECERRDWQKLQIETSTLVVGCR